MKKKECKRRVDEIVDGDTFKVRNNVEGSQYIRIAGSNAPEKGEPGHMAAKRDLERKIGDKRVTIRPVSHSYGRTVAEVPAAKRKRKK